jgi:hypothetical protein
MPLFQKLVTGNVDIDRIQDRLVDAFVMVGNLLNQSSLIGQRFSSYVVTGNNGQGSLKLAPIKNSALAIIRRARVGMLLVAAVDLTGLTDVQASFERTLSKTDAIKQIDTANLSAKKILIVIAG